MEIVIAILVFLGVVLVAVLFFGGWVIVSVVGLIARAIGGNRSHVAPAPVPRAQRMPPPQRIICAQGNCRAPNAAAARFCRRCGRPVAGPVAGRGPAVVRRVAMW